MEVRYLLKPKAGLEKGRTQRTHPLFARFISSKNKTPAGWPGFCGVSN
jgi:hypothetical protein